MSQPRPSSTDDDVVEEAAKALMPEILKWMEKEPGDPEEIELLDSLTEAVRDNFPDFDAYKIASDLEHSHYWNADTELVYVLEGLSVSRIVEARVAKWVTDNAVKPPLDVGARIQWTQGWGQKDVVTGTIVDIRKSEARYIVHEHGKTYLAPHVGKDGKTWYSGTLIEYEQATEVPATEPPTAESSERPASAEPPAPSPDEPVPGTQPGTSPAVESEPGPLES